jgi:hypothetical protein
VGPLWANKYHYEPRTERPGNNRIKVSQREALSKRTYKGTHRGIISSARCPPRTATVGSCSSPDPNKAGSRLFAALLLSLVLGCLTGQTAGHFLGSLVEFEIAAS